MAQGAIKKPAKPTPSSHNKRARQIVAPKKGKRSIAPRKSGLVRAAGITKKHSAGLSAKTESLLAQKVGHLELLQGGKNSKAKSAKKMGSEKKEKKKAADGSGGAADKKGVGKRGK